MKSVINLAAASTILFSLTCTLVSQLWAKPLVAFCLNEPNTVGGTHPETFSLCLLRRGSVDALLQFAIRALGGGIEVVWATPMTESFGLVLGLVLLRRFWGTWIDA